MVLQVTAVRLRMEGGLVRSGGVPGAEGHGVSARRCGLQLRRVRRVRPAGGGDRPEPGGELFRAESQPLGDHSGGPQCAQARLVQGRLGKPVRSQQQVELPDVPWRVSRQPQEPVQPVQDSGGDRS